MANRINNHILQNGSTASVFGNFSIEMEAGNSRPGRLITHPIDRFEKMHSFFEWEWFHSFNTDFFEQNDTVLWIGSCIAEDFADHFDNNNYTTNKVIRLSQGVNSFRGLEVYLRWLFDDGHDDLLDTPPWEGYKEKQFSLSKRDREMIRTQMEGINKVVIFTGSIDVVVDLHTGKDLYQFPPNEYWDKQRHIVRRLSYEENKQSLQCIIDLINKHTNTELMFVMTPYGHASQSFEGDLPPLPLTTLAKSMIRSAINELAPTQYFPMYDLIIEYFTRYKDKGLHIHNRISELMMRILANWYGNFDQKENRQDIMDAFNRERKVFLVGALTNKALPNDDVEAPVKNSYTLIDDTFDPENPSL